MEKEQKQEFGETIRGAGSGKRRFVKPIVPEDFRCQRWPGQIWGWGRHLIHLLCLPKYVSQETPASYLSPLSCLAFSCCWIQSAAALSGHGGLLLTCATDLSFLFSFSLNHQELLNSLIHFTTYLGPHVLDSRPFSFTPRANQGLLC
jgi:hypothetical protein